MVDLQRNAWLYEIRMLKDLLRTKSAGQVIFEYSIPRLGKRIDVVLLLHGIVFVLEFKVVANGYLRQALGQIWNYALDLIIVSILVAADAGNVSTFRIVENRCFLQDLISKNIQ